MIRKVWRKEKEKEKEKPKTEKGNYTEVCREMCFLLSPLQKLDNVQHCPQWTLLYNKCGIQFSL
jgi:hypothetical protein